jgi:hypothetical protein
MRFRKSLAAVLSLSFIAFQTLSLSPACAEVSPLAADSAKVMFAQGSIEFKAPGEASWQPLSKGDVLPAGSEIRTSAASACEIGLGEAKRSVVRMKEDSQTTLETLSSEKTRVNLGSGKVMVWVRDLKPGAVFEVASPTAVASARGTAWEQDTDSIQVFEDDVELETPGGDSMIVEEGMGLDVREDGSLGEVFEVPAEAKAEFESFQQEAAEHSTETESETETAKEEPAQEEAPTEEEEAPAEEAETENAFDSFGESFGPEGFEDPASEDGSGGDMGDALSDAKDEAEESEPPAEFDPDLEGEKDDEEPCTPSHTSYPNC